MTRLTITVRLTVGFAAAMVLMLIAAALFVALRLRADLDNRVNNSLRARNVAALRAYRYGTNLAGVVLEDPEESFVQLLDVSGAVRQSAGTVIGPAVLVEEVRRAEDESVMVERDLPGVDGPVRILATGMTVDGQQIEDMHSRSRLLTEHSSRGVSWHCCILR